MALCAKCGAAEAAPGRTCGGCGAVAAPELTLDLSNDPAPCAPGPALAHMAPVAGFSSAPPPPPVVDIPSDARLLADFGEPPRSWLREPLYSWRVMKRRREIRAALVKRREESARTATEAEDALVAFAERVRAAAERLPEYAARLKELRRAEDILRSRDKVLASEQDAQNARLAQVDARLAKLEGDLAQARAEERRAATELAAAQAALARQEAKLRRAESELRTAQKTLVAGERAE